MQFIKHIFLSGVLCLMLQVCCGQVDSAVVDAMEYEPVTDTLLMTDVDMFNYAFPPKARPHQLAQEFLAAIQQRSVDPVAMLDYMESTFNASEDTVYIQGATKNQRPVWVLLVVFLLFLAVAIVRFVFPGDFSMIVQAYYDERTLMQVSKEDNMLTSWPYVFLYLIFSFALALFIVLMESSFVRFDILSWENYLRTASLVALLFIVKIIMLRFISFVFEIERFAREYITVLYLVYFNSMIFLMPFLLAIIFVSATYFKFLLILYSVLVSMLFLYRFLRTAFRLFGNLKLSVFYLILYLCALEVAPILILVRTLSN